MDFSGDAFFSLEDGFFSSEVFSDDSSSDSRVGFFSEVVNFTVYYSTLEVGSSFSRGFSNFFLDARVGSFFLWSFQSTAS